VTIQHIVRWTLAKSISAMVLALIAGLPVARAAITLKFFPASDYSTNTSAMNAVLGVRRFTLDDFSEAALLPGLSITLMGGDATTPITYTTLPAIYNQNTLPSSCYNSEGIPNLGIASWTGATAVTNAIGNAVTGPCNEAEGIAATVTFNYPVGATSIGIGLANFQSTSSPQFPITNHELFINGVDRGVLETLAGDNWLPGIVLNAYMRIDATGGSVITSVAVMNLVSSDFFAFSDLAIEQRSSTSTELSASPTSGLKGTAITFTATVAQDPGSGVPTGTVAFMNGSALVGTATLNTSGVATWESAALPAGSDSVTAAYRGDSKNGASTSAAVVVSIKVAVPDVVGLTQAAAAAAIIKSGLTVGTVSRAPSTTVPQGSVVSENPAAGSAVAPGVAIDLVISTGPR
jgi:hypothetical protein